MSIVGRAFYSLIWDCAGGLPGAVDRRHTAFYSLIWD